MKVEKFKVLLYLKKSGTDKSGKAPIMGRITVNRTMAQFGCKLSCKPELWNARESRLDGKSREAVETNAKLDKLLLAVNAALNWTSCCLRSMRRLTRWWNVGRTLTQRRSRTCFREAWTRR